MLILTRRVGETLMIGDEVTVTVLGVKGNQAVCVTTRVNHYQKSHHAEIPSFIPEPCSDVGRTFCPAGCGENGSDNRGVST